MQSVLHPRKIDEAVSLGNATDEQLWRFLQKVVGAPNMTRLLSKGSRMCATEKKNAITAFRELVASSRSKKILERLQVLALVEVCRSIKEGDHCSFPNADERDLPLREVLVTTWVHANFLQLDGENGENIFPRAPLDGVSEDARKHLYVEAILVKYDVLANGLFACDGGVPIPAIQPAVEGFNGTALQQPPTPPTPMTRFAMGGCVYPDKQPDEMNDNNRRKLLRSNVWPHQIHVGDERGKSVDGVRDFLLCKLGMKRLERLTKAMDFPTEWDHKKVQTEIFRLFKDVFGEAAKKPVDDAAARVILKEPVGYLRRLNTMKHLLGLDNSSLGKQVTLAMEGKVLVVANACFPSRAFFLNPDDASKKIGSVVRVLLESLKREEEEFYGRDLMTAMESSMSPVTGSLVPAQPEPQTLAPAENTEPDFKLSAADREEARILQLEYDHNQTLAPAEGTAPDFEATKAETYEAIRLERMYERLQKFGLV